LLIKMMQKIKSTLNEWWRVLRVTKRPDATEFKTIVKVSGLGMMLIGALGFIIQMFRELLR
jgi:protein transport protein SEC61 subunit gamma and related proteins